MLHKTGWVVATAILSVLLLQCRSEPARPPDQPNSPASGELQFPTGQGFDATSGGAASTTTPPPPATAAESTAPPPPSEPLRERTPLGDEQIAAISDVTNTAEIEQATLARKNAKDARVKKFAEMMITHHGRAKQDQAKLLLKLQLKPQESTRSSELSAEAAGTLSTLKNAKAGDFERLYIDSQVTAHRAVLEMLDKELVPNAKNVDLRGLLQSMRQVVQSHLDEARKIQDALATPTAPNSPKNPSPN